MRRTCKMDFRDQSNKSNRNRIKRMDNSDIHAFYLYFCGH